MNEAQITISGNLVADPELRYTPNGVPVANFRIASTPRQYDRQAGEWIEGESLFLTCTAWKQFGENVAKTLTKGMRVLVTGELKQRSYQTREGEQRISFEMDVRDLGPSLRWADAQVNRNPRQGDGGQAPQQQRQQPQGSDPWGGAPTNDRGGFGGSDNTTSDQEPPF